MTAYFELQATSHFSFLRGASSCEELFAHAAVLGLKGLAIVDRNSLAGIVRAHEAAKTTGIRLIVGCRLDLVDGMSLLVYPTDRAAYSRLCRLLSVGKKRGGKAKCILEWNDVLDWNEGLLAALVPDEADDACALRLRKLRDAFGGRAYMALTLRRRPNDQLRLHDLNALAQRLGVRTVVTNDVLFHEPHRRILQDVVTCIRHNTTIDAIGFRRERHADRYIKSPEEMARLFARYPEALARTAEIAQRCAFNLDELAYQYPEERTMPGLTPQQALEKLAWEGAAERYPEGLPDDVRGKLRHELDLIQRLQYAPYFLTVNSIVQFARSKDILCQGRGSAANSAVCYVLGITSIDPERNDLLFERFVSEERREPPDIDVDFEHERREIVMQWVFETYRHVGLSLRRHPVEFLRTDLAARRVVTCADAMAARDGRWLEAAGLVLVRQRPGSAKGVMFITIEDETGIANLVVWPSLFEKQRRVVLSAGMMSVRGRIQREGEVVHLVAQHLTDLSIDLASVGDREGGFPLPHGRGDQIRDGGSFGPDQRDLPPRGLRTRDIYIPDLHIDSIKVKTRDFR